LAIIGIEPVKRLILLGEVEVRSGENAKMLSIWKAGLFGNPSGDPSGLTIGA
jgi:hypothetical protein